MEIQQLLQATISHKASDLHLLVGKLPMLRVDARLLVVPGTTVLTEQESQSLVFGMLSSQQRDLLLVNKEIDFSFGLGDQGRFRVNAYFERGRVSAALRLIPSKIRTIDELSLPS